MASCPNAPVALAMFFILNVQPLEVPAALVVVSVAAGSQHTLFIKSGGSLWAMGFNDHGQLGDGTANNAVLPECIVPPPQFVVTNLEVAGGTNLVLRGLNELGEGVTVVRSGPKVMMPLDLWTPIWTNDLGNGSFSFVLTNAVNKNFCSDFISSNSSRANETRNLPLPQEWAATNASLVLSFSNGPIPFRVFLLKRGPFHDRLLLVRSFNLLCELSDNTRSDGISGFRYESTYYFSFGHASGRAVRNCCEHDSHRRDRLQLGPGRRKCFHRTPFYHGVRIKSWRGQRILSKWTGRL